MMNYTCILLAILSFCPNVLTTNTKAPVTNGTLKLNHLVINNKDSVAIHRVTKIVPFHLVGVGPLYYECPQHTEFRSFESYSMCMDKFNENDVDAEKSKIDKVLVDMYNRYCIPLLEKKEKCKTLVNIKEAIVERFRTMGNLKCDAENAIFIGLYYCQEKVERPVAEGEVVTLLAKNGEDINAVCPEGKRIKVESAFDMGTVFHNGGTMRSALTEAANECDGKQSCTTFAPKHVRHTDKYVSYKVLTYKCLS